MSIDLPSSQVPEACADEIDAAYLPFASSGFVSLTEDGEKVPIKILRDSGALGSVLHLFGHLQCTDYISFQTWYKGRWASQYAQHCW